LEVNAVEHSGAAAAASGAANPARELESKALKLSRRERARLAQRLISSLDQRAGADTEKLWLEEAKRRLGEFKSGKVTGVPAARVIKKAGLRAGQPRPSASA
jgi:putative addiction module component (TIGR02574 family)